MKDSITELNINYFDSSLAHITANITANTSIVIIRLLLTFREVFQTSSSDANTVNLIIDTSHVRTNKKLSCRKETVRLLRKTVLTKYNWKTIFCGHYR